MSDKIQELLENLQNPNDEDNRSLIMERIVIAFMKEQAKWSVNK